VAEARLEGELGDARLGMMDEDPSSPAHSVTHGKRSLQQAGLCQARFADELDEVRVRLSAASVPTGAPNAQSWPGSGSIGDDLAAAGLQRRVGLALAAAQESLCRLEEERLQKDMAVEQLGRLQARLSLLEIGTNMPASKDDEDDAVKDSVSAAVAAADVNAAPAIAAAELQARLAALRGQLHRPGLETAIPDRQVADDRSLQVQLQALREQLNGKV